MRPVTCEVAEETNEEITGAGPLLVCPRCKRGDTLATIEQLQGISHLWSVELGPDGLVLNYTGYSDEFWDTSERIGIECRGTGCDWEGQLDELALAAKEEEATPHATELGDLEVMQF